MLSLPVELLNIIVCFAPLFSKKVFQHVKLLLAGAILAPGIRTITSPLPVMGRSHQKDFQTFHRVLNRAVWSALTSCRKLLGLLLCVFAPTRPLLFGIDHTIERRGGDKIAAKGI
jgi:hypothetical protein